MLRPLLRRVLWVVGVAGAFVLLALLGSLVAVLLSPTGTPRPEPEPVRRASVAPPPRPAPPPEPAPPPPVPAPSPVPPPAPPPPAPAPVATLPLTDRLRVRRELMRGMNLLRRELAGCPSGRVPWSREGRAALVLELQGVGDGVQVVGSALEANVPVNDRYIECARTLLQGKTLATEGVSPGLRLRYIVPIGPGGSSLSLSSSSLAGGEEEPPR